MWYCIFWIIISLKMKRYNEKNFSILISSLAFCYKTMWRNYCSVISKRNSLVKRHIYIYICLYIYKYIYCHRQTDCFSVAWHVGRFKLGLKLGQLYVWLSIIPPNHQLPYVSSGIIRHSLCSSFRLFTFCLTGYQSAQFLRRALHYLCSSH